MNDVRARAYGRVMETLRDVGPAKLWPVEQAHIREAADALLFCHARGWDDLARQALISVAVLADDLIDADRWTPKRAQRLLDDIWACGPWDSLERAA